MAWMGLLKVVGAMILVFGVLPRVLFRPPESARGPIDRFLIDFLRTSAFLVALVHVLVPLRLFQWTGILLTMAVWTYVVRLRPAGWTVSRLMEGLQGVNEIVLYFVEAGSRAGNERVKRAVARWWRLQVRPRLRPRLPEGFAKAVVLCLPLVALLLTAFVVRVHHPLVHEAFAAADNYVHLAWMRYLEAGELFHDGVYPQGMHALLVVPAKLTHATSYDVLRFAGPLFNTGTVLLMYLVVLRITRSAAVGMFTAAFAGVVGFSNGLGLSGLRQTATLPQEVGVFVAFAGILMIVAHVERMRRERLLYAGLAGFAVMMIHPVPFGLIAAGAAAGGLVLLLRTRRIRPALTLGAVAATGAMVSLLYLFGAMGLGLGTYADINVNPVVERAEEVQVTDGQAAEEPAAPKYHVELFARPLEVAAMVAAAMGLLYGLLVRSDRGLRAAMIGGFLVVCAAVPAAGLLRGWFMVRWWEDTVRPLLPLAFACAVLVAAALWNGAFPELGRRFRASRVSVAMGTASVVALLVTIPPVLASPRESQIEYDAETGVARSILKSHERLTYTLVGPPAWYDHVVGMGYHVHSTDFADNLDVRDAVDPSFQIPIPTRHVYVLTEKEPFPYAGRIDDSMLDRYYDPDRRAALMRDLDDWMRTYDRYHDAVEIAYEDDQIRVWSVEQEPDPDYAKRFGIVDEDGVYEDPLQEAMKR